MRRKRLGILEHNTVDWRRQNNIPDIYSDYDGFGQEKYLTQFQQLILIVMTKKGTDWMRYKKYKSLCSRICEISLYFSNLKSKGFACQHSHFPGPYRMPGFSNCFSACPSLYLIFQCNADFFIIWCLCNLSHIFLQYHNSGNLMP